MKDHASQSITITEAQELMRENLSVLQFYAERVLVEQDDSLVGMENFKNEIMAEYMSHGKSLLLTERDLVVLLLKQLLNR